MNHDNPTKFLRHKAGWSENLFRDFYNLNSKCWELMSCHQDYNTFDFWLLDREQIKRPRIVELKAHIGKISHDRELIGCDFIKIQKLRSLAIGTKAYVFHLFEDKTLVQDVDTELELYKKATWSEREVLLGLIKRSQAISTIDVGLERLRALQVALDAAASQEKSPGATVQEKLTHALQHGSHE